MTHNSSIASIRENLIAALTAQGADRIYAIGYVADRVHLSVLPSNGQALAEAFGRHCGDHPEQLRDFAGLLQSEDPTARLGAPVPRAAAAVPPAAAAAPLHDPALRIRASVAASL